MVTRRPILLALLALAPFGRASATPVTVCEEVAQTIAHPAQYIQEKVRREGVRCLFLPHCCTPAWVTSPDCYVMRRVKAKDAWEEVQRTLSCKPKDMSSEQAFQLWMKNLLKPVNGFAVATGDLSTLLAAYVSAAYQVARPLPADVRAELSKLVAARQVPFTATELAEARMLPSSNSLARRLWPASAIQARTGGKKYAITYYRLIIYDPASPFARSDLCGRTSSLAHELTHVHQYVSLGWDQFLVRYLAEGVKGYQRISFEEAAKEVERRAMSGCV